MLQEFAVDSTRARDGRSIIHFAETGPLPRRTAYFWCHKLVDAGYLRAPPATCRCKRRHSRSLASHTRASNPNENRNAGVPQWKFLSQEFRLGRSRYLNDIELTRVSIGGGTDFDHDVVTQSILADMLGPPTIATNAPIRLEPWHRLTVVDSNACGRSQRTQTTGCITSPTRCSPLRTTATFYALSSTNASNLAVRHGDTSNAS